MFSDLQQKSKFYVTTGYSTLLAIFTAVILTKKDVAFSRVDLDAMVRILGTMAYQMEGEIIFKFFILPVLAGLFLADRKGAIHARSMAIILAIVLLSLFLLEGFTGITNQPYRTVAFMVFFSIAAGMTFEKGKPYQANKAKLIKSLVIFIPSFLVVLFVWIASLYPDNAVVFANNLLDII